MAKQLNKETFLKSLRSLYDEKQSEWILQKVEELLQKYRTKIKDVKAPLTEKDVMLITYGDNVQQKGNSHLQTLKKFIDNYCLPEINTTHILPCFPYTSDDGFSVTDYYEIDPNLGTWEDIEKLSQSSNIMFDAVVNHMSKSSKWFQSFLAQEEGFKDFFVAVDPSIDLSKVVRPRALPLLTPFKTKQGKEIHVWTTFSEDQVDLNPRSPEVFIAILDVLLFYTSKGGKFIRLDAIAFLWKEIGTNCIHLPETHLIIKLHKEIIRLLTDDLYIITETNVPHKENISYFGNGEDDGIGMRPLQNIISDEEVGQLAKRAEKHGGLVGYKNNEDGSQSPYELNCNYMDLLSAPEEDDQVRADKMMLTQSVMLAMPGVPGIYFHSLVGSRNYYKGVEESGIKRRINREKLNYEQLADEIADKDTLRHTIFNSYKKILKIRTNQKAFNPLGKASYRVSDDKKIFVIKREHQGETIYAVYNFSNTEASIKALSPKVLDLENEEEWSSDVWKLNPYQCNWLKVN